MSFLTIRDLMVLCQSSWYLHRWSIGNPYLSWEYCGYIQSFRSLHCFLRTVIENPSIATYVKTLDIRDWGETRRLEDHVGYSWPSDEDSSESA